MAVNRYKYEVLDIKPEYSTSSIPRHELTVSKRFRDAHSLCYVYAESYDEVYHKAKQIYPYTDIYLFNADWNKMSSNGMYNGR